MERILPLLKTMRDRVAMYVGASSLTRLAAFLRGYDYALAKSGVEEQDPFLSGFRDWIHARYKTTAKSWEDTILENSANETEALALFWKLVDEFLKESKSSAAGNGPLEVDELEKVTTNPA